MVPFFARHGAGELLARYSFVEPLLASRRVLEIGAARATGGLGARFLAERGAAAVLSIEPDEASLAEARAAAIPGVELRAARPDALPDGAFDVVLLADGEDLLRDPALGATLRRLLAEGGRLVAALGAGGVALADLAGDPAAAEAPPYDGFAGALAACFPSVEVATQSATVGWVIALGDGEGAELSIDGALAGESVAAAYLAVCGDGPSGLSGLTLVALPPRPLLEAAAVRRGVAVADALAPLRAARDDALGEVDRLRAILGEARAERTRALEGGTAAARTLEEVRGALEDARLEAAEARGDADTAAADAAEARAEADLARSAEAAARDEAAALRAERDEARREAGAEAELARAEAEGARVALGALRAQAEGAGNALGRAREETEAAGARALELEALLAEVGARLEASEERTRVAEARAAEAVAILEAEREREGAVTTPA